MCSSRTLTAGREFRPALKIFFTCNERIIPRPTVLVKRNFFWYTVPIEDRYLRHGVLHQAAGAHELADVGLIRQFEAVHHAAFRARADIAADDLVLIDKHRGVVGAVCVGIVEHLIDKAVQRFACERAEIVSL